MMDKPALPVVTVVTPVLNQRDYIEAAVRSVLAQDYENLEYLVIDGGSTDGTLEILRRFDNRLTLISEPDTGQANAINKGLYLARGEILAWLNADDLYFPGAVEAAVEALTPNPDAVCVYGDCDYIDPEGKTLTRYPARPFDLRSLAVAAENFIPQPAAFFRRACLETAGYLNEDLNYVLDYELWLRFSRVGQFVYLPKKLAQTRLHAGAKSVASFAEFGDELVSVIEKAFEDNALPIEIEGCREEALSSANLRAAHAAFWAGEFVSAIDHVRRTRREFSAFRQKMVKAYILLFGGLARLGLPAASLLKLLGRNPYLKGAALGGRHE
jgi:glycosyltransferase involved in cell wall biosynthesis